MNMVHSYLPWETETGSAGEQPVKGYHGQTRQTMRGRGGQLASRPSQIPHRMIDLSCLKNAKDIHANQCPENRGRYTTRKSTIMAPCSYAHFSTATDTNICI